MVIAAATVPAVATDRRFRQDIEGLRAVAVVLVLLFHADVPRFAGGYVGVDVFFVLSGYLITRLLLLERASTGTIALPSFYGRRLRRLLPAAGLVIVVTVAASRLLLPPLQVGPTATDGLWAAGWLANVRFIRVGLDYLAGGGAESPLLHYWSLAVEEQFYLLWPAVILLVARGRRGGERRVGWMLVAVTAASFAASVAVTRSNPVLAYYGLPTRAWEFGVGAILALAGVRQVRLAQVPRILLSWGGLVAVVLAGVTYTLATPFPGWTALLPVLGTAAVILAGEGGYAGGANVLLRLAPLQLLGRLSYALYLWHWPVLVLGEHAIGRTPTGLERAGMLLLSGVLAWATFHLLEDPVRRARVLTRPGRSLVFGGTVALATAAVTVSIGVTTPRVTGTGEAVPTAQVSTEAALVDLISTSTRDGDELPASLRPPLDEVDDDRSTIYEDGCFVGWTDAVSAGCTYGDPQAERTAVLFGDSHAAHWFPAIERVAEEEGWRLIVLAKASCPSIDVVVVRGDDPYPTCEPWRQASIARVAAERPDVVVLSNARTYPALAPDGSELDTDRKVHLVAGQARTLEQVVDAAPTARIVLIGSSARPRFDVPACLADNLEDESACDAPAARAVDRELLDLQRRVAEDGGARFVDPTPWLCTDTTCPAVVGDHLVYADEDHIAVPYSRALAPVLGPWLTGAGLR